jgi:hypothetical protein
VDAIRIGNARETELAVKLLEQEFAQWAAITRIKKWLWWWLKYF